MFFALIAHVREGENAVLGAHVGDTGLSRPAFECALLAVGFVGLRATQFPAESQTYVCVSVLYE